MKCKDVKRAFHLFLDGELKPDKVLELQEHISHCSDCQTAWQDLHELRNVLHVLPRLMAPKTFTAAVIHAVNQPQPQPARYKFLAPQPLLASAAVVILAVVVVAAYRLEHISRLSVQASPEIIAVATITPSPANRRSPELNPHLAKDDAFQRRRTMQDRNPVPLLERQDYSKIEPTRNPYPSSSQIETATFVRSKKANF